VLVDDIISTARTMMAAIRHLAGLGLAGPVCVGVHAVFAGTAYADLAAASVARIATCNTFVHESNAIDVSEPLADAVRNLLAARPAVPASGSGP
jgi:ribose-phosphate pyrophosphokinase